ncbi:MAG TPA: glycosyltransferase family 2 protein [Burkholderiales bacterium]|nr:glycosyltransferase family 2 protein [Burkholderiales bacterium]
MMSSQPAKPAASVAVVVVNWNGGELLARCLRALAAQTVQPKKILVVDNASSDGSCERVAENFPQVILLRQEKNLGFAAGNNVAVRAAGDCDWIALINPDAFAEPGWLEALLTAAHEHPECSFFGSRMLMADAPELLDGVGDVYHISGLVWREGHGTPATGAYREEKEIFSPCGAAAMYKRAAFVEAGGFDEDYFCYVEDVDLGFRLRLLGHRCLYVPQSVVLHKGSALTGKRSDFSIYYGHRNLVWTFVKNFPGGWFWIYLPLHLAMNFAALLWFSLAGHAKPIWRAKLDALKGLSGIWSKRRFIQRGKRIQFARIKSLMATRLRDIVNRR